MCILKFIKLIMRYNYLNAFNLIFKINLVNSKNGLKKGCVNAIIANIKRLI